MKKLFREYTREVSLDELGSQDVSLFGYDISLFVVSGFFYLIFVILLGLPMSSIKIAIFYQCTTLLSVALSNWKWILPSSNETLINLNVILCTSLNCYYSGGIFSPFVQCLFFFPALYIRNYSVRYFSIMLLLFLAFITYNGRLPQSFLSERIADGMFIYLTISKSMLIAFVFFLFGFLLLLFCFVLSSHCESLLIISGYFCVLAFQARHSLKEDG
jgi:hypothetical protein